MEKGWRQFNDGSSAPSVSSLQSTTSKTSITQLCPADQDVGELHMSIPKTMEHQQEVESRQRQNHCLPLCCYGGASNPRSCSRGGGPRTTAFFGCGGAHNQRHPFLLPAVVLPGNQQCWSQQRYLCSPTAPPSPSPYSHSNKACTSSRSQKRSEVPVIPYCPKRRCQQHQGTKDHWGTMTTEKMTRKVPTLKYNQRQRR